MGRFLALCLALCCLACGTGCTKEEALAGYNDILGAVGGLALTSDRDLQGRRSFGGDSYVGDYRAEYSGFTGSETLFGGTGLERELGDEVAVTWDLALEEGTIRLVFRSVDGEPQVLWEGPGRGEATLELPAGSNYLEVQGEGLTGSVALEVE